jgi:TolA-binding protein
LALFDVENGKYQLAIKNPKKARQTFEQVIKKYPNTQARSDASYYIIRAHHNLPAKDGSNDPYIEALTEFVKNFPDSPHWAKANLEIAELWERNEEYGLSARAYRNALEKGVSKSGKPGILRKLSKNYSALKSFDLAISFARQLIREFPQHTLALDARIDIGTIYLPNKGDHEQAISELRPLLKVVIQENEKANIRFTIAESYFNLGDYTNARREFLTLRYNQKVSDLWVVSAQMKIADCDAALGNMERAIQELEEIKIRYGATSDYGRGAEQRIQGLKSQSYLPGR